MSGNTKKIMKIGLAEAWIGIMTIVFFLILYPVNTASQRMLTVLLIPLTLIMMIFLVRRFRLLISLIVFGVVLTAIFLCLPGKDARYPFLQEYYLQALEKYKGCPYYVGGETCKGIDCSGLVRRSLIDANLRLGFATLDPAPLRTAFLVWWYKPDSRALIAQDQGLTYLVCGAPSINSLTGVPLSVGDIAVTADGNHSLAYAGNNKWIHADPYALKVVDDSAPSNNRWFKKPVCIVRWSDLEKHQQHRVERSNRHVYVATLTPVIIRNDTVCSTISDH